MGNGCCCRANTISTTTIMPRNGRKESTQGKKKNIEELEVEMNIDEEP